MASARQRPRYGDTGNAHANAIAESLADPGGTVAPAPTPRPRPTTNIAGQQLMTYYFQTRALFPIFPPTPRVDFDEPAGEEGDAWYSAHPHARRIVGGVVQRREGGRHVAGTVIT